jgi:TM2 domain-containing membrane protein YozV
MYCRQCGKEMQPEQDICLNCGFKKGKGNQFCPSCGVEVLPEQDMCVKCGVLLKKEEQTETKSKKSKLVAGLLGILLGPLGVGRFYLGYTAIGVLQIVVTICTCGLGGLWGFIDGILNDIDKHSNSAYSNGLITVEVN